MLWAAAAMAQLTMVCPLLPPVHWSAAHLRGARAGRNVQVQRLLALGRRHARRQVAPSGDDLRARSPRNVVLQQWPRSVSQGFLSPEHPTMEPQ